MATTPDPVTCTDLFIERHYEQPDEHTLYFRQPRVTTAERWEIIRLRRNGYSRADCSRLLGLSLSTVKRYSP